MPTAYFIIQTCKMRRVFRFTRYARYYTYIKRNTFQRWYTKNMILVNTDSIPNYKIVKTFGIVKGTVVQTKTVLDELLSKSKYFLIGDLGYCEDVLEASRQESINKMIGEAEKKGANAILNVTMDMNTFGNGSSEILTYGTSVKIKPKD